MLLERLSRVGFFAWNRAASLRSIPRQFMSTAEPEEDISFNISSRVSFRPVDEGNKLYKASFGGGNPESRKTFSTKKYIMPISIGQKVHENGRLASTLDLVAKSFLGGVVLVDDVIQRHTLKIFAPDLSDATLYSMAKLDGDVWLDRYTSLIKEKLTNTVEIIRWEYFLTHQDFSQCEENVHRQLRDSSMYKESFDRNINEFIGRLFSRQPDLSYQFAYAQCKKYLIEECSAMQLWMMLGVQIEVYPSDRNHAMQATNRELIEPRVPGGLEHTGLRFKKLKAPEPEPTIISAKAKIN